MAAWQRLDVRRAPVPGDPGAARSELGVVTVDGEDVGRFWLTRHRDVVELSGLELLPEWRARGVGAEVLRRLVTSACGEDRRLELEVDEDNVAAQRFYEREGLVRVAGSTRRRRYAAPGEQDPVRR